jgi:protein-tyrosine phosphatase
MGTVHGVYLKYVGISALSYMGYSWMNGESSHISNLQATRSLLGGGSFKSGAQDDANKSAIVLLGTLILGYSTLINGVIAILFKTERGMSLLGKNRTAGTIPKWSYFLFFPFHVPTYLYTHIHTRLGQWKKGPKTTTTTTTTTTNNKKKEGGGSVPVATEVQPGWWVGGCYGHELEKDWGGVIDLTVEFPESCRDRTKDYLSLPTWDGVPCTPAQLEVAAQFSVKARTKGDVLVHCAHGRGRSTTVMCACLVRAGLYPNWMDAFDKGIKPYRSCCKLNSRMKQNLTAWQAEYVDGGEVPKTK